MRGIPIIMAVLLDILQIGAVPALDEKPAGRSAKQATLT